MASRSHVDSPKTYAAVLGALLFLTALTVTVSYINLGPINIFAALAIAGGKASLVILFFMHVRHSSRLTWMVFATGLIWLLILFVHTLSDYLTRGMLGVPGK